MAAPRKKAKTGRKPYTVTVKRRRASGPRDISYLKPPKFKHYLTLSEMAEFVPCDPTWLKFLEREERIPKAQRVQHGQLMVRLWSPEQAEEIRTIIDGHKVGRPPKG